MIVQYAYISWSPPRLMEQEELELGRRIAQVGREQFEREFRESIKKAHLKNRPPRTGIAAWPEEVRYIILIVLFGAGGIFLVRAGLAEQFMARVIPLCVIVMLVYYGSVFFAVRRFNKWVDYLIAKYARQAATAGR
jgi:hypothetical protein